MSDVDGQAVLDLSDLAFEAGDALQDVIQLLRFLCFPFSDFIRFYLLLELCVCCRLELVF